VQQIDELVARDASSLVGLCAWRSGGLDKRLEEPLEVEIE
jgi:hypothetical protein